jgi:transposase, IS30 family
LYLPDLAEQQKQKRRVESKATFESVIDENILEIKHRLKEYHSPEQGSDEDVVKNQREIMGFIRLFSLLV